jgi:nitrate reductase gamma subunit
METLVGMILPYVAAIVFLGGSLYRVAEWMRAPRKLNWKLYPVPEGLVGETSYILEEWASFKTLFRHNRVAWLGSYLFHVSLVALVVWFILFLLGPSIPWLVRISAVVMLASCIYLIIVRLWVPQMRALSSFVEFFNLVLFVLMAWAILNLTGEGVGSQARSYFLGLIQFKPVPPPRDGTFLWGLFLVEFFVAYLPFSKMFHAASKYFAYHRLRWSNPYELLHRG